MPLIVCPGNHDSVPPFEKLIGPANQVLRLDEVTIALADSSVPGEPHGYLADETLAWLDGVLPSGPGCRPSWACTTSRSTSAFRTSTRSGSRAGTAGEAVCAGTRTWPACSTGHAHTAVSSTFAGVPLVIAPGVISTCLTTWRPTAFPSDYDLPPAFALHIFDGERLVTHFRPVILK